MTKINQNIATDANAPFIAGDTRTVQATVEQSAGAPFNLTGAAIKWQVFAMSGGTFTGSPIISKSVGSGITITNAAGGIFQISLASADTTGLAGTYYHEAEVTMPGGIVHTALTGTITIKAGAITPP